MGVINRFAVLESAKEGEEVDAFDIEEIIEEEGGGGVRKGRAASAGVAELMKALKPGKKGNVKGRKQQVKVGNTTLGGQTSISSL